MDIHYWPSSESIFVIESNRHTGMNVNINSNYHLLVACDTRACMLAAVCCDCPRAEGGSRALSRDYKVSLLSYSGRAQMHARTSSIANEELFMLLFSLIKIYDKCKYRQFCMRQTLAT